MVTSSHCYINIFIDSQTFNNLQNMTKQISIIDLVFNNSLCYKLEYYLPFR